MTIVSKAFTSLLTDYSLFDGVPEATPMPLQFPFLLHALIEFPASLKFFLKPDSGLVLSLNDKRIDEPKEHSSISQHTQLVIRQYAILLFVSVIISILFATRELDDLARGVGGSIGIYHVGPVWRAAWRIAHDDYGDGRFDSYEEMKSVAERRIKSSTATKPFWTSIKRLRITKSDMGGPIVHFVVHTYMSLAFLMLFARKES